LLKETRKKVSKTKKDQGRSVLIRKRQENISAREAGKARLIAWKGSRD